ncbi:MAG: DNA mismatch repair protein MutS [Bacillota bacterium]
MTEMTPMMRQYLKIKEDYQDCILFYRLGDFYEMFFEDALIASKVLGIVLTSRQYGYASKAPMCGIPYHSIDTYLPKLLKKGHKVAICEQIGDPNNSKGPVERQVVRVITPGTVIEDNYLVAGENNYIVNIYGKEQEYGVAICDLSTGEFKVANIRGYDNVINEVLKLKPAECLVPEGFESHIITKKLAEALPTIYYFNRGHYNYKKSLELLTKHFQDGQIQSLGLYNYYFALIAAGALFEYLQTTLKNTLTHISTIEFYSPEAFMMLDYSTRKNLELITNLNGGKENTLLETIDTTVTAGGARLLRQWIEQPIKNLGEIISRQTKVELFYKEKVLTLELRSLLKEVYDMERLISKIVYGSADAKDMLALKTTLKTTGSIKETLSRHVGSDGLHIIIDSMNPLEKVVSLIDDCICDTPASGLKDGGIIREGFNEEVDKLRNAKNNAKTLIANIEREEKEKTGIKSLKVGYNKVFGYYLEVTRANLSQIPGHYIRKQTLANCERYITPELKEFESLILDAEDKLKNLEYQLFQQVRNEVIKYVSVLKQNANCLAQLDVLSSLAVTAENNNYVKPLVTNCSNINIQKGRHPVVEKALGHLFVPNNLNIGHENNTIMLITGPNMAGKSTYLRQNALIILLAQIGSFVPAEKAEIGVVDRIFSRIGSSDNLAYGQSTFMVEMQEVANIVKYATSNSLIILDEVGRGTSTYDGVSLAWAITEYIYSKIQAKTLFATHYHELTRLQEYYQGIKNYNVGVIEKGEDIIFQHAVFEGSTDKSYGVQVAKLAGLPHTILDRARTILNSFENGVQVDINSRSIEKVPKVSLVQTNPVEDEIDKLNIYEITPIDALNILSELQNRIRKLRNDSGEA